MFNVPAPAKPAKRDPRYAPGAYATNGTHLYEVIEATDDFVQLENVVTEFKLRLAHDSLGSWRIVRDAPAVPDYVIDADGA